MTNPKDTDNEIDEILNDLAQYVHGATVASKNYGIFIGGEPASHAKDKIKALLNKAVIEARIEEWNLIHETLHSAGIVSELHVNKIMDEHITQLKQNIEE